jgi:hypothetical protein
VLHLTKSQITERLAEAQQATHVAEPEKANAQLREELDAALSKLAEVDAARSKLV